MIGFSSNVQHHNQHICWRRTRRSIDPRIGNGHIVPRTGWRHIDQNSRSGFVERDVCIERSWLLALEIKNNNH